jgi:hypothetical protein
VIAHAVGDGSNDSQRGYRTYDPAGVVGDSRWYLGGLVPGSMFVIWKFLSR